MNPESWDILNLDPSSSLEKVRKQFRKLVLKHHPDKGGSPYLFDKIKNAYRDIVTFHAGLNQKSHYELKQQIKEQNNNKEQYRGQLNPNSLNMDKFNNFFVQHRLEDPLDHGYGHLMEESNNYREEDSQVSKMKIKHFPEQQLILYKEPEEVFTYNGAVTTLGDENKNFTAAWNQRTKYTDYMEAHSTPVDHEIIPLRESYNSIDALKASRTKSLKPTKKELKQLKKIEEEREKNELRRMSRLNKHDKKTTTHYNKLQNLLGL